MGHDLIRSLTAAEREQLRGRLWQMLVRQAALYTDSTSLPEETARALWASIRFSLELYLEETGPTSLLAGEPDALLREAERTVRRKVARTRLLYLRACRCQFQEESLSLSETLAGIGGFFRAYDPKYFAAEIPCDIDYQLARPVPEDLGGISYIHTYLTRLLTEDTVLRRLHPEAVRRLLGAVCPVHRELLVNLYEPAAAAAIGVTLTEGDLFTLDITPAGQARLGDLLGPLSTNARLRLLLQAGERLARRLEVGPAAAEYLRQSARDLLPRVEAVLDSGGDWQGLFPVLA